MGSRGFSGRNHSRSIYAVLCTRTSWTKNKTQKPRQNPNGKAGKNRNETIIMTIKIRRWQLFGTFTFQIRRKLQKSDMAHLTARCRTIQESHRPTVKFECRIASSRNVERNREKKAGWKLTRGVHSALEGRRRERHGISNIAPSWPMNAPCVHNHNVDKGERKKKKNGYKIPAIKSLL